MNWDNVEMIRNAQASNKKRFDEEHVLVQESINRAINTEVARQLNVPHLTELEQMIFKMRTELIDYIVAHGLVDGLVWNGVLQPVDNGKIVITKEMVDYVAHMLGYYKEDDVNAFIEKYLPEHNYVADADYVHTDNNFTDEAVAKLDGIEDGAEVNKVIDILFNGTSVLDDGTRVATITITPEDIKSWYESNPDTNAFTDKEKAKLAGISDGAEVNRVDDVLVNKRSVLDENKKANITKEIVKEAYEANDNTNAFTDAEKERLADIDSLSVFNVDASALKNIASSIEYNLDGEYTIECTTKITLTSAAKKTQVRTVELFGYAYVGADNKIFGNNCLLYYANASANDDGLQSITITGGSSLKLEASIIVNRDNFNAASVSLEFLAFTHHPLNVMDVQADGESVVTGGVANLHLNNIAADRVPYTGAEYNVNLGRKTLTAIEVISTENGITIEGGGNIVWDKADPLIDEAIMTEVTSSEFEVRTDSGVPLNIVTKDPVANYHAATKNYVDEKLSDEYVPYSGASKAVDLNGQAIENAASMAIEYMRVGGTGLAITKDLTTLGNGATFIPQTGAGLRLQKHTSTERAPLEVADPTTDTEAATKKYVDDAVAKAGSGAITEASSMTEAHIAVFTCNDLSWGQAFPVTLYNITGSKWITGQTVMINFGENIIFERCIDGTLKTSGYANVSYNLTKGVVPFDIVLTSSQVTLIVHGTVFGEADSACYSLLSFTKTLGANYFSDSGTLKYYKFT